MKAPKISGMVPVNPELWRLLQIKGDKREVNRQDEKHLKTWTIAHIVSRFTKFCSETGMVPDMGFKAKLSIVSLVSAARPGWIVPVIPVC